MVKIFIDPGHGGIDAGSVGNGLKEKDITLQIALSIRKYLRGYKDVSLKMSRTTDKTVTLSERTKAANNWGAEFLLSIHINAGGGTGFESYIYKELSTTSATAKKRSIIHNKIKRVISMRDRGEKTGNLHVLRESKMAAVLTENGFIDTKSDAIKMKDKAWIDRVAKAHAEGITELYNLKKIGTSAPPIYRVGEHVKIKTTATNYATGEKIPAWVKNKDLTIQQIETNRVLLKEIYSWVNKSDVTK